MDKYIYLSVMAYPSLKLKSGISSKIKYPGAIKKNKHVLAVERDNKTWQLAKILEVRKSQLPP